MNAEATTITPPWWDEACAHLASRDEVLRALIARYGSARLASQGRPFTTLARSIVGQQISVKAAASVWERFEALFPASGALTPAALLALPADALRGAGLSARKVEYLRSLAQHFEGGLVHPAAWPHMSDAAISAELTAIRGIGQWTADMFLIFHLLRPNVLPLADIGLIRAISLHYAGGRPVSRTRLARLERLWRPWCSAATWYMWRALDPLPVAY